VDCFHGVCHSLYLENVCTIGKAGGFYGSFSLLQSHEEAQKFQEIFEASNPDNSIVCSSVLSAVQVLLSSLNFYKTQQKNHHPLKFFLRTNLETFTASTQPHAQKEVAFTFPL
jgi:hypothetical protein